MTITQWNFAGMGGPPALAALAIGGWSWASLCDIWWGTRAHQCVGCSNMCVTRGYKSAAAATQNVRPTRSFWPGLIMLDRGVVACGFRRVLTCQLMPLEPNASMRGVPPESAVLQGLTHRDQGTCSL